MSKQWDISVLELAQFERKFKKLPQKVQRKVVARAARNSAKRGKDRIVQNLSGHPVGQVTGDTRTAFQRTGIRAAGGGRNFIRVGPVLPTRELLGIPPWPKEKSYYPFALEYGTRKKGGADAKPYIRPAIDEHIPEETSAIAAEMGPRIASLWRGLGR